MQNYKLGNHNFGTLQSLVSAFFKTPLLKPWIELRRAVLSLEMVTASCGGGGGGGAGAGGGAGGGSIVCFIEVGILPDSWGSGGGEGIVVLLNWTELLSSAKSKNTMPLNT